MVEAAPIGGPLPTSTFVDGYRVFSRLTAAERRLLLRVRVNVTIRWEWADDGPARINRTRKQQTAKKHLIVPSHHHES